MSKTFGMVELRGGKGGSPVRVRRSIRIRYLHTGARFCFADTRMSAGHSPGLVRSKATRLLQRSSKPETEVVVAIVGRVRIAIGSANVPRVAVPTAAT